MENTQKLTRLPVKWIRDGIKSKYKEKEPCYICGSTVDIELHHIYSVSELWNNWILKNKIKIISDADVLECRKQFEEDNSSLLCNDNLYSLCKAHHTKLHQIYGKSYSNYMGDKVRTWLERQRIQHFGDTGIWQEDQ
jgi:hypothetical protein